MQRTTSALALAVFLTGVFFTCVCDSAGAGFGSNLACPGVVDDGGPGVGLLSGLDARLSAGCRCCSPTLVAVSRASGFFWTDSRAEGACQPGGGVICTMLSHFGQLTIAPTIDGSRTLSRASQVVQVIVKSTRSTTIRPSVSPGGGNPISPQGTSFDPLPQARWFTAHACRPASVSQPDAAG